MLKMCVLSSFLNTAGLAAARMSGGSEFHAAGPACEKERSPMVRSRGVTCIFAHFIFNEYCIFPPIHCLYTRVGSYSYEVQFPASALILQLYIKQSLLHTLR